MGDLISRQEAIDAFDGVKVDEENCTEYDIGYNDGIDYAVSRLSVLPSAKPEHSAWVNARDGHDGHVKCKVCFKTYDWDSEAQYFNFCPNCGKDVRGEKNEHND